MKEEKPSRLAIVNLELCKPKECSFECKKACPVNKIGKKCIEIKQHAEISEVLCIGCSACVKKCPFKAITIVNLPTSLEKEITFRYGKNLFKLHRLPTLKLNTITGLVGTNGIGKSTAISIFCKKIKPNFGLQEDLNWKEIIGRFKGSELHGYFTKLANNEIKITVKNQYVDKLPDQLMQKYKKDGLIVKEVISIKEDLLMLLEIDKILDKTIQTLSGGELQRLFIYLSCIEKSQVYLFDEPTSYLDVKQRLNAAKAIRTLKDAYILVVEHDLAILDLMCDQGCVIYGKAGAYGVISKPYSIKQAINVFLDGVIPTENMRFREVPLKFEKTAVEYKRKFYVENEVSGIKNDLEFLNLEDKTFSKASIDISKASIDISKSEENISKSEEKVFKSQEDKIHKLEENILSSKASIDISALETTSNYSYNDMIVKFKDFELKITKSSFSTSEIILFLGENGMGKSTFVNVLAGLIKTDSDLQFNVSLKPQKILPKFNGTVKEIFLKKIKSNFSDVFFYSEVIKPLKIDYILDQNIQNLSGGELQRIAIILCLGKPAQIYLIDEPSAYLDSDQRIIVSKVIKKYIYMKKATCFVVEHDLIVATYLADKVVVFEGVPSKKSVATSIMDLELGMNLFLKNLNITFRREPTNNRPRVNKPGSAKDREQKEIGKYFF